MQNDSPHTSDLSGLLSLFPQTMTSSDPLDAISAPAPVMVQVLDPATAVPVGHATLPDTVETPIVESQKLKTAVRALKSIEQQIGNVLRLLGDNGSAVSASAGIKIIDDIMHDVVASSMPKIDDGKVVEGVFDGVQMIGGDGKTYTVPPNYASKSKLVEGDMLKLTITSRGSFIYKQTGPIERSRIVGALGYDQTTEEFYVTSETHRWAVIKASVTYFKGDAGDEAVILVPKGAPSRWAAVENILKKDVV